MAGACIFRQWRGEGGFAAAAPGHGERFRLSSRDPAGEKAQLVLDGGFSEASAPGVGEFRGALVQDSGPFTGIAPIIMLVAFAAPERLREEVDRWYREEHVPLLTKADGWLRARRYTVESVSGPVPHFSSLAFHELADVAVLDSKERAVARSTEWRARLERDGDWFSKAGRWIYDVV